MLTIFKHRWLWLLLSLIVIMPGLIVLATQGLRLAIDFTGGSVLEVVTQQPELSIVSLEEAAPEGYEIQSVQKAGEWQWLIKGTTISNDTKNQFLSSLQAEYPDLQEVQFITVGPILGQELIVKTAFAVLIAAGGILLYLSRQFAQWQYGAAAIIAMLHDSLVLVAIFAVLGWWWGVEIDVLFVTALLTTLSFSVHDTVVVFDRIRELKKRQPRAPLQDVATAAVIQTLGRSLNNSLTIIIMLTALVVLGGESIRWFAVALLVGAISGNLLITFYSCAGFALPGRF